MSAVKSEENLPNPRAVFISILMWAVYLFILFLSSIVILVLISIIIPLDTANSLTANYIFAFFALYYIIDLTILFLQRISFTYLIILCLILLYKGLKNIIKGEYNMDISLPPSSTVEKYMIDNIWCKIFSH